MEAEDFSLFGLLGRSWSLEAAVVDLAFDHSDGAVAFALADGSVAIARLKDAEPAARRIRVSAEDGRATILPRTRPLPPLVHFPVCRDRPPAMTAYGKHGIVIADDEGRLLSVTPGGERTPFTATPADAPIIALDHAADTGLLALASEDGRLVLLGRGGARATMQLEAAPGFRLRFSPDGERLAVTTADRILLFDVSDGLVQLGALEPPAEPVSIAWSPDRMRLACGYASGGAGVLELGGTAFRGLGDYPSPVRALAWSAGGDVLITSGAFRIIAWSLGREQANGAKPLALETGRPSLVAVETVAAHRRRRLIAAGYENGMVILAEPGKQDELPLKHDGQGAITAMSWSEDGGHIAVGSDRGLASIIELPPQIFKS
jgi:WD40 repeat protein